MSERVGDLSVSSATTPRGAALIFSNVSRSYGRVQALRELSFAVPRGSTCAFIGANGAGKTTTFSLVGGFLTRYAGEISLELSSGGIRSLADFRAEGGVIGVMPQDVICFEERTIRDQLVLFSELAGRSGSAVRQEVSALLEATDLLEHADKCPLELSHGMRVRFAIAQAFVGEPELVLLDEPTAGLDPLHLAQIRTLLVKFKGKTTLLVSSHDLSELQGWCDYVVMIENGRCVRQGSLNDVIHSTGSVSRWTVIGAFSVGELGRAFPSLVFETPAGAGGGNSLIIHGQLSAAVIVELVTWFDQRRCAITSFDRRQSLEEAYLKVISP
jgi:ABC-type multidrug transport system ATPase subunit